LSFAYDHDDHYPRVDSDNGGHLNNFEAGAFINYYRLVAPMGSDTNFYGVGGRVGVNVSHHMQLEAEGAYDPEQNVSFFTTDTSGAVVLTPSPVTVVHFMFGPKFQVGTSGPVRFFVTAKGGLINFAPRNNFAGQVNGITTSGDTFATFYPGLGFEFFAKFLGVRFEAGDEMYFDGGVNHNVYVTAGPVIRF